ncbi:hypothetical protein LPJ63_001735 [Coemansia sp. RSA 2711]|nr:hypothetical protein LPJ63_001735 [Coemansia sp. RSA 2711]
MNLSQAPGMPQVESAQAAELQVGDQQKIFTNTLRTPTTSYIFYVYTDSRKNGLLDSITKNGGKLVSRKNIDSADFVIHTKPGSHQFVEAPTCHPLFVTDSIAAGRMLDYKNYLVEDLGDATSTATSVIHNSSGGNDDDISVDISNMFDGTMDAEDQVVDTFLSSHSRSISEYTGHEAESPGAQSTNSAGISDSDYRIRRTLDKHARDIREMPTPNSPLSRQAPVDTTSESQISPSMRTHGERVQSPDSANNRRSLRGALESSRSLSFIAKRQMFESVQSPENGNPSSAVASRINSLEANSKPAQHSRPLQRNNDGAEALRANTAADPSSSPELGMRMPTAKKPVADPRNNETTIDEMSQELLSGMKPPSTGQFPDITYESDDDDDDDDDEDDDDDNYPDPLSFLESRSPHPRTTSPLKAASNEDPDTGIEQNGAGELDGPAGNTRGKRCIALWKGLGKRRRRSSNGSEYGEEAVAVVVDRRTTLSAEAVLHSQSSEQLQQSSALHTPTPQRAQSFERATAPIGRRIRAMAAPRSASKRIRMSNTESPDNGSDHNRTRETRPVADAADLPSSAPAAVTAENHANHEPARPQRTVETIVFAEASSSFPTTSSSAPQVSSSLESGIVAHVSQTPNMLGSQAVFANNSYDPEEVSPELMPLAVSSTTEPTELIPELSLDDGIEAAEDAVAATEHNMEVDSELPNTSEEPPRELPDDSGEASEELPERAQDDPGDEGATEAPQAAVSNINDDTERQSLADQTEDDPIETPAGQRSNQSEGGDASDPGTGDSGSAGVDAVATDASETTVDVRAGDEESALHLPNAPSTPPPSETALRRSQRLAATTARAQRTSGRVTKRGSIGMGAATQPQPSRQRRPTISRRITMCQRLMQLSKLSKGNGRLDMRMDPALAQPARLLGGDLRSSAFSIDVISAPSTPTRRAAFSGTMRVLGEGEPIVTDSDRLRYMCKVKGLIEGTEVSAREAMRVLYYLTGDWVSARRYILHGESGLTEDCMWSAAEDKTLLQDLSLDNMEDLRKRKGNVEVYRRLQFLSTFHERKTQ